MVFSSKIVGPKSDYTELITITNQITIYLPQGLCWRELCPNYETFNRVYHSNTGFTKLRILNLIYETMRAGIEYKYDSLDQLAVDGFKFDETTSSVYVMTSS